MILTISRQLQAAGLPWLPVFMSFTWPSVAYTLDILAWDVFFALSILFAAPVFKGGMLETTIRIVMIVCGGLSLAGLIGVPLANMQVRDIGVVGYALVSPIGFLLLGILFGATQQVPAETRRSLSGHSPSKPPLSTPTA